MPKYVITTIEERKSPETNLLQKYYKIGDTTFIQNGYKKASVDFFINEQAFLFLSTNIEPGKNFKKKALILPPNIMYEPDYDTILPIFIDKYFEKIKTIFLAIIGTLAVHYKGYPSPFVTTEHFELIFDFYSASSSAYTQVYKEDFSKIIVVMNTYWLSRSNEEDNYRTLYHELLHPISQFHEKENSQIELINNWNKRLDKSIEENKKYLESVKSTVVDIYSKHSSADNAKKLEKVLIIRIEAFFEAGARKFWNLVADTALGIIAIELHADSFIQYTNQQDTKCIVALREELTNWNDNFKRLVHLEKTFPTYGSTAYLTSILKLLQFISCYYFMPSHGIAWGVLSHSHSWASHHPYARLRDDDSSYKIIQEFEEIVKSLCYPDVSKYFLGFYHAYLDIVKAGAIHNNPLDPDITKEIHDTGCLKRSSHAYKLLNRAFYAIFSEVKKNKV